MVLVPPRHYCVIKNPVRRDDKGEVLVDSQLQVPESPPPCFVIGPGQERPPSAWHAACVTVWVYMRSLSPGHNSLSCINSQVQLVYGEEEIRTEGPPFPLYPGEILKEPPTPLTIVPALTALRLSAIRDFTDAAGIAHVAGDEWHFVGPVGAEPSTQHAKFVGPVGAEPVITNTDRRDLAAGLHLPIFETWALGMQQLPFPSLGLTGNFGFVCVRRPTSPVSSAASSTRSVRPLSSQAPPSRSVPGLLLPPYPYPSSPNVRQVVSPAPGTCHPTTTPNLSS